MDVVEIVPSNLREDTISTLGISSTFDDLSWARLEEMSAARGYRTYRDRFDPDGVYGIYVGWNSDRTIFRSYKVTVRTNTVVRIEARYSYPDI